MLLTRQKKQRQSIIAIRILIAGILMLYFVTSCGNEKQELVDQPLDRETMPAIHDDSVTMFISDSGIIRYKVLTKDWQIFDTSKDPHWYFPKGLYVERFDSTYQTLATLKADTAWNFTQRRLWRLKGHVFIRNTKDETFSTEELFWDERLQKVYSDKYIEINRPEKLMLKGIGFESNMSMTQYRIFKPHDTNVFVNETSEAQQAQDTQ
ncbi:LPS export ABC transporter periplasmic protein LptC [Dysgonomonas macrotermitis]|uniref:LPS export ABC transporter protein LptC n=1 Tax=Dysgonomonas macrotermitis TaxID=1346286 RepID=A0A1M5BE23_9BACT|nr:LPS export ABC transporter periplasmic protein LptC [Dysgonomonas macrotermitis]SHF40422.1 LPS export ABC transporter protein LptC [Dysgonomonas macrotermitis]